MIVVVTATGTEVGKTWVGCALARALVRAGERVVAVKPFESGGGDDGERLAEATGQTEPRRALVRLREPLTPALAAEREGVALDLEAVVAEIERLERGADVTLVEGAGGVLSPLTWDADATTLARRLGAKVLLVAPDALGALSAIHTAVHALRAASLEPAAIALVEPAARDASTGTNAASLRKRLGSAPPVFEVARDAEGPVGSIARALETRGDSPDHAT